MITKLIPLTKLKQMFLEILLNKTDKINDIANESVLNSFAYGVAKVGQKMLVNLSIIEGHIFPDASYGEYLDRLAKIKGVSERFKAAGSSTYVRIAANPGTTYLRQTNKLISTEGYRFSLQEDVTIGDSGYAYVKVKSDATGEDTNVNPISINKMSPTPQGHIAVVNEYRATGGRNDEDDETFRIRIKENVNVLARTTLSYLEQVFMKINNNVLKLHKGGIGADGKMNIIVVSVNGVDFTDDEFNEILMKSEEYLSLEDLLNYEDGAGYSLKLSNVTWVPVDVDFRLDYDPAYDIDKIRREIQIQMNKLFDYRFWKYGNKVEWENMLYVAKNVEGVTYVPDNHFYPANDINVPKYKLPRVRGFVIRDLDGNILEDNNGVLNAFYYPAEPDFSFQSTVLKSI